MERKIEIKADLLTAVLHYCGDSELTNGKTIVKNSKLTNGIAFFPQQMQSHKTLVYILREIARNKTTFYLKQKVK